MKKLLLILVLTGFCTAASAEAYVTGFEEEPGFACSPSNFCTYHDPETGAHWAGKVVPGVPGYPPELMMTAPSGSESNVRWLMLSNLKSQPPESSVFRVEVSCAKFSRKTTFVLHLKDYLGKGSVDFTHKGTSKIEADWEPIEPDDPLYPEMWHSCGARYFHKNLPEPSK